MNKLKLGKMKTKELAEWMNISPGTFSKYKDKKFEILKKFCDFEEIYGGVIIKEIYIDTYSPKIKDDEFCLQKVKEASDGLATVSGISLLASQEKEYADLSFSQIQRRMKHSNENNFGPMVGTSSIGKHGSREYIWCIKLYDKPNHYRYLTKEEDKLFSDLIKQICNSAPPENLKKIALLEKKFKEERGSLEEFIEARDEINKGHTFGDVLMAFKQKTGYVIVRATKYELNENLIFED